MAKLLGFEWLGCEKRFERFDVKRFEWIRDLLTLVNSEVAFFGKIHQPQTFKNVLMNVFFVFTDMK